MILEGDCIEAMRKLDEASIDAIVCDPPYGIEARERTVRESGQLGLLT